MSLMLALGKKTFLTVNPGVNLSEEEGAEVTRDFQRQREGVRCVYDGAQQAFRLACSVHILDECLLAFSKMLEVFVEKRNPDEVTGLMLEEDADEFGVDEAAVEWESDQSESDDSQDQDGEAQEEEEGTPSNRGPMILSYRFQEIWRSGQSSTQPESFFHPRFMAVISQVAQLTDSFIEPDWDAMEMTISGDDQADLVRAKNLLSTIERHLHLRSGSVTIALAELSEPSNRSAKFVLERLFVCPMTCSSSIGWHGPKFGDRFILRARRRNTTRTKPDDFGARASYTFVLVPGEWTVLWSLLWGDSCFRIKGNESQDPIHWLPPTEAEVEEADHEELQARTIRTNQWVAQGAQRSNPSSNPDKNVTAAHPSSSAPSPASGSIEENEMVEAAGPNAHKLAGSSSKDHPSPAKFGPKGRRRMGKRKLTRSGPRLPTQLNSQTYLNGSLKVKSTANRSSPHADGGGALNLFGRSRTTRGDRPGGTTHEPSKETNEVVDEAPRTDRSVDQEEEESRTGRDGSKVDAAEGGGGPPGPTGLPASNGAEESPVDQPSRTEEADLLEFFDDDPQIKSKQATTAASDHPAKYLIGSALRFFPPPSLLDESDDEEFGTRPPRPALLPFRRSATTNDDVGSSVGGADSPVPPEDNGPAGLDASIDDDTAGRTKKLPSSPINNSGAVSPNVQKAYEASLRALELAAAHHEQIAMHFHLGKILVRKLISPFTQTFLLDDWDQFSARICKQSPYLNTLLSTSINTADAILNLHTLGGERAFEALPVLGRLWYEFCCLDPQDKEIIIEVDADTFAYTVRTESRMIGSVWMFFPESEWDAKLCITGRIMAAKMEEAAKYLVDNLYIKPNQIEPSLSTRVPAEEVRIRRVMLKRQTQHLVHPGLLLSPSSSNNTAAGRIVVQVTEVQDLIVRHHPTVRGGFRAYGTGRQAMIDDRQGARLWYEVEVLSLTVNNQLKANEYLEFGHEANWKPKEVLTERIMTDLYRVISSLVAASDDLMRMNQVDSPRHQSATTDHATTNHATAQATSSTVKATTAKATSVQATAAQTDGGASLQATKNKKGLGNGPTTTTTGPGGSQKGSNSSGGVHTIKSTVYIQPPPQTFW